MISRHRNTKERLHVVIDKQLDDHHETHMNQSRLSACEQTRHS